MATARYRVFHAFVVATVIALGTWVLVKQFCNIPSSWRADAGTAIFRGKLPPIPQYDPPDTPPSNHHSESNTPSLEHPEPAPPDPTAGSSTSAWENEHSWPLWSQPKQTTTESPSVLPALDM